MSTYRCPVCGKGYTSKADAELCHGRPSGVAGVGTPSIDVDQFTQGDAHPCDISAASGGSTLSPREALRKRVEGVLSSFDGRDAASVSTGLLRDVVAALAQPSPAPAGECSPTLTECPRCKNDISKCDGLFAPPAAVQGEAVPREVTLLEAANLCRIGVMPALPGSDRVTGYNEGRMACYHSLAALAAHAVEFAANGARK